MGSAIGQSLSFAVGVALSPVPIIAVVLMLGTPRARSNGPAFVAGWLGGIAIVGLAVLALAGSSDPGSQSQPAEWVSVLKLVLGILLLGVATLQWRGRPRDGAEPAMPKWMKTIDSFTPVKAAGFGVLLSSVNPKNLLLVVGGAAAIAQAGGSSGTEIGALAVFALVATLGTGLPLAAYFALGSRSERFLGELKTWLSNNNAAIMSVVCLVIAAKLIGDAISAL